MAVPPVLRLALRRIRTVVPAGGIESGAKPLIGQHGQRTASSLILLSTVA